MFLSLNALLYGQRVKLRASFSFKPWSSDHCLCLMLLYSMLNENNCGLRFRANRAYVVFCRLLQLRSPSTKPQQRTQSQRTSGRSFCSRSPQRTESCCIQTTLSSPLRSLTFASNRSAERSPQRSWRSASVFLQRIDRCGQTLASSNLRTWTRIRKHRRRRAA